MTPNLLKKYREEIVPAMSSKFGYKTPMQAPRLEKVVVNMGVGEAISDIKILDKAMEELAMITGQKPIVRRAKIAISNFKIRQGLPIGAKVTLRGNRMYEFLDRLINTSLPRIRDFRGVPADSFDGQGNYTLGMKEQAVFPEIDIDKIPRVQGMDITIVIKGRNKSKEESFELLKLFGMPFSRHEH